MTIIPPGHHQLLAAAAWHEHRHWWHSRRWQHHDHNQWHYWEGGLCVCVARACSHWLIVINGSLPALHLKNLAKKPSELLPSTMWRRGAWTQFKLWVEGSSSLDRWLKLPNFSSSRMCYPVLQKYRTGCIMFFTSTLLVEVKKIIAACDTRAAHVRTS